MSHRTATNQGSRTGARLLWLGAVVAIVSLATHSAVAAKGERQNAVTITFDDLAGDALFVSAIRGSTTRGHLVIVAIEASSQPEFPSEHETRHEAFEIPLPRASEGFVEVVRVEDQPAFR